MKTFSSGDVYLELLTATESENYRLSTESEPKTMECFWAQGGSARLMKRKWVGKDEELINLDLPYVNGANFDFTISKTSVSIQQ